MTLVLKMPRMGMNVEDGTIIEWHKKPGENFSISAQIAPTLHIKF